ncbi:hypothetical protein ENSA5_53840 [Enhygromyxa salina]|uniref:Uncharacterized protein n=1 Tax=Enhygromyxa salina TaxID=215803 RepID=A0A2S9XFI3_9BACT|nr:hypothetical protein [Enhygromyxa salina]PRP91624.1 hypothetical protein ENSA5_53840 [Enhygromyxa salina]
MFAENRHYGHAAILLSYCGLPARTRIPVRLQHGWQPGVGMRARDMEQPGPKIVWSSRNLERAREADYRGPVAIGAPWLYMPETLDPGPDHPRSVLVVPFHGWEKERLDGSMSDYASALEQLEAEGFGPITVCLYWFEYEQPALREVFERRGFATTTMGHRNDNPEFLRRQRALIQRHAFVSSNRVSTATFYALEAGRPFFLHGPVTGLSASDDPSGEQFDRWQRETFPELTRARFDERPRRALGGAELGAEHKRSPEALRDLLLLGPEHRGARTKLRLARRAHDLGQLLRAGR